MPRLPLAPALAAALIALSLFASAGLAQDGHVDSVDLESAGAANVKGTLRSAAERESFAVDLPAGAQIAASVKRRGKSAIVPQLDLVDAVGTPVPGTVTVALPTGMRLSNPGIPVGGVLRLRVFSDFNHDGDYTLKFTTKVSSRFTETGTAAPGGGTLGVGFGAPAGSEARVKISKPRTSAFLPVLDRMTGAGGFDRDLPDTGDSGWIPIPVTGDYAVTFHDGGAEGGEWSCAITLRKVPKVRGSKIDISAGNLTGSFDDDQPVYGILAGEGETLVDPDDLGLGLDGASVLIPEGGLSFPVVITMSVAPNFTPPGDNHAAGPAITFGPEGQTFNGKEVTITIPFDTFQFADPENDLTVYVLHQGDPIPEAVPKPYTFPAPGLVSFPRASFSTYQAVGAGPRPVAGDFVFAGMEAQQGTDFGGVISVSMTGVSAQPGGTYSSYDYAPRVTWSAPAAGPNVTYDAEFGTDYGNVVIPRDDTVRFESGRDGVTVLHRGRNPDILVAEPDPASGRASFGVLLRKVSGAPTYANLAGRYHLFFVSAGADGGQNGATLYTEVTTGTAVVGLDGAVDLNVDGTTAKAQFPIGTWAAKNGGPDTGQGRIEVSDGVASLLLPGDQGPEPNYLSLAVCAGGDVLVTVGNPPTDDNFVLFLVREAKGLSKKDLTGSATTYSFQLETLDGVAAGGPSGFEMELSRATATFSATGRLSVTPSQGVVFDHDAAGNPAETPRQDTGAAGPYTVTAAGVANFAGSHGFVAPGASFFLVGSCSSNGTEVHVGIPKLEIQAPTKR